MKIHFIAIGGNVMHNLAIALKQEGNEVSGSDDTIYDPSASRLRKYKLFPESLGWYPERITSDLDAVIIGRHAQADNPELSAARDLGIKSYTFPEYIYEKSKNKQRIVIGGSHGKSTVTAMVMHALQSAGRRFDYVIGAHVRGFKGTLRLTEDAPVIIIEGDEYTTSADDPRPKFLHYRHHMAVMNGISWDHANAYPTEEEYTAQFERFAKSTPKAGTLFYYEDDKVNKKIAKSHIDSNEHYFGEGYSSHKYKSKDGKTILKTKSSGDVEVPFFGKHNMINLRAAQLVLSKLGVKGDDFYKHMASFEGVLMRMDLISEVGNTRIFRDYAHSPSKLEAGTEALKDRFPKQSLTVCAELHTFSSLNKSFIGRYKNTLKSADTVLIYFNPENVSRKNLDVLSAEDIKDAFGHKNLYVFDNTEKLRAHLSSLNSEGTNILFAGSGNFNNLNTESFAESLFNA